MYGSAIARIIQGLRQQEAWRMSSLYHTVYIECHKQPRPGDAHDRVYYCQRSSNYGSTIQYGPVAADCGRLRT